MIRPSSDVTVSISVADKCRKTKERERKENKSDNSTEDIKNAHG